MNHLNTYIYQGEMYSIYIMKRDFLKMFSVNWPSSPSSKALFANTILFCPQELGCSDKRQAGDRKVRLWFEFCY